MNGDFLGFSFDGIHSSRLGITRVSDGNRYNESLTPEIEDKIISVPGEDGSYFFGSLYRNKTITLSIAFDSLNESQFRQLNKMLAIKRPCKLILDERPYKVYTAKISAPPQLNYVCFDEPKKKLVKPRQGIRIINRDTNPQWEKVTPYVYDGERERIYKGEGTIEFTCIQPYATEQIKMLDYYGDFNFQPVWGSGVVYRNNPRTEGEAELRAAEDDVPTKIINPDPEGHGELVPNEEYITNPKYHVINLDSSNSITIYTNVQEWAEASGILPYEFYMLYGIDVVHEETVIEGYNAYIPVYNAGDIDTPFYLFLPYTDNGVPKFTVNASIWLKKVTVNENAFKKIYPNNGIYTFTYSNEKWYYKTEEIDLSKLGITYTGQLNLEKTNSITVLVQNTIEAGSLNADTGDWIDINVGNQVLRINPFQSETTLDKENGVIINTKNHLIEGVFYDYGTSSWRTTGNIYNEYIAAGDFVKIKNNDWSMFDTYDGTSSQAVYLNCRTAMGAKIHYNYLYY